MTSRRRITVALVGLLVLVVGVWLAEKAWADDDPAARPASSAISAGPVVLPGPAG